MMDYFKSLEWVDYYFFSIIDPRRLMNLITRSEGSPFLMGYITLAVVSVMNILTFSLISRQSSFFYQKVTYGWILIFLLLVLFVIVYASMVDLFCQFRGKQGNAKAILNLMNISFFTHALILPLFFIFKVINFAPIFFLVLFILAVYIWQALIITLGISELHQTEFAESLVSFLFPSILIGVIIFFTIILSVVTMIGFISFT
ncbi:MAG: hypothetical protein MUC95_10160 [Spirochaetes bacterium]|nr:hypothetical protein [Spirochaetota bacterium]